MRVTEKLVDAILAKLPHDKLAAHLGGLQQMLDTLENHRAAKVRLVKEYEANLRELDGYIQITQKQCPHWLTKRHRDPSGGSDSWTECELCGAEIGRDDGPGGYDG